MLIEGFLQAAREQLVTVRDDTKLIDVANFLSAGADLVIVCDGDEFLQGVVTKTDVLKQISTCTGATCMCPVGSVMTRDVTFGRGSDRLADVSGAMKQRHLKNIPVVDEDNRTVGVLTAPLILRGLLSDSKFEEFQLIDYVAGVGYR